jgi:hypothetical protein
MKKPAHFARRLPDVITLELAAVLSSATWFEFKPLFLIVHGNLRARNAANVGEEMLRLRTYDKLQNFVQQGFAEKVGKQYRGIAKLLAVFAEQAVQAAEAKKALALAPVAVEAEPEPVAVAVAVAPSVSPAPSKRKSLGKAQL